MSTGKSETEGAIPAHVPQALVHSFDFRSGLGAHPQEVIARLAAERGPIIWSPVRHVFGEGGSWIVLSAELVRAVASDPETYSSTEFSQSLKVFGDDFILAPLGLDPPRHTAFRALINPLFTPTRMYALTPKIESWCNELIDRFAANGRCDFVPDFADQFPTGIFIDLMGLDRARVPEFVEWVQDFIHGETPQERFDGARRAIEFFEDAFRNPENYPEGSMIRYLRDAQPEGHPLSRGEFLGTTFMVFTAGLDTVVSSLGFIFRMLAEDQALQQHLRKNPGEIARHVEEMLRLFSPVTPYRRATRDAELGGQAIKAGDMIELGLTAASRDPAMFAGPEVFDPSRNPNSHFAFSTGIHRCAGAQLARRDLATALEVWLKRIPPFRLGADSKIVASGGPVQTLAGIVLEW